MLFDVGNKPEIFLANLKQLGIEKSSIQATIISHDTPLIPAASIRCFRRG